jgi:hypothetical protein
MIEHNAQNNVTAMNVFTGGNVWVKSFYSDCAPEFLEMHEGSSVEGSFCPSFSVFHFLSLFVSLLQTSEKQNTIRRFQCVSRQK